MSLPCKCGSCNLFIDLWLNFRRDPWVNELFVRCADCGYAGPGKDDETSAWEAYNDEAVKRLERNTASNQST